MKTAGRRFGPPELLILSGGCLFVFLLWFSAWLEPDIRRLHFFQAWMYIAAMLLALLRSRWGYFIGISAAGLWDYVSVFVNTFFAGGLRWSLTSIRTRHVTHLDQIIAVPAWIANFLVVAGCVWAYSRLRAKHAADLGRAVLAFIATTAFFAACVAAFQPRYLQLFRGILHPHRPW